MERKLRVLLIIGRSQSFSILDLFDPLADAWEISAASFLADMCKPSFLTRIALQTHIEDPHLPGYMRGLEEAIVRSDLIVASSCTDQASLQALRFCQGKKKPLLIFISDGQSFRQSHEGDTSNLEEVLSLAQGFVVSDKASAEHLSFLKVENEKIVFIPPQVPASRFGFQPQLRKKFREYIGLSDDQFLILCSDYMENYSRGTNLLMAVKYLMQRKMLPPQKLRVLFAGTGPAKDQLKYLAVDSGISSQVFFISQDTSPFLRDLYCAADLGVSLSKKYHTIDHVEGFSSWILEGLACGLRPLIDAQHPLAIELSADFTVDVENFEALALGILRAFHQNSAAEYSKKTISQLSVDYSDVESVKETLKRFAERLVLNIRVAEGLQENFSSVFEELLNSRGLVPAEELLGTIDGALMLWENRAEEKGKLELLKGQVLLRDGNLEAAMALFEQCTADERLQHDAYIGLGHISFATCAYDEALSFFRKALAIKPNDVEAMAGLGHVYRKAGKPDDAVYWLGKSINIDSENKVLLMCLTQACLEADDAERSIAVLEQLRPVLGEKAPLIMALGQLYYRTGEAEIGHLLVHQALNLSQDQDIKVLAALSNVR